MKNNIKKPYCLLHIIILAITFILLTISMFFVMLEVSNTIYSTNVTYVPKLTYQLQTTYEYQCSYMWINNGYQNYCRYVPVTRSVPVMTYAPQYNYITTVFTNDVHLYDIILSCFSTNVAKIICISILLFALISSSILIHSNKSILHQVGYISYNVLTVMIVGSTIGVFRLLVNNFDSTSTVASFYLVIIVALALIGFSIYSFVRLCINTSNKENKLTTILRFVSFILLVVISEITITNLYGFLLMILLVTGIVISTNRSLVCKIIGTIFTSGVFIYSFITMIIALVEGLDKTSFFKIIPVDSLIFRILSLGIFIIMLIVLFMERKVTKRINIEA